MPFEPLPFTARLSTKVVALLLGSLLIALFSISFTLWLSWQLEGGAAAINDAGSLRMRTWKLAGLQERGAPSRVIAQQVGLFEETLGRLRRGDPIRPLALPAQKTIQQQLSRIVVHWHDDIRPSFTEGRPRLPLPRLEDFVEDIDRLVVLVERNNARVTTYMRLTQMVLMVVACFGTFILIYLMYLLIVQPVQTLSHAMIRLREGDLSTRVPVETQDDLGRLAEGFNDMAASLQELYENLEGKVREKTLSLEARHRDLTTLYELTALLNRPASLEDLCDEFIRRLVEIFAADAGCVRLVDPDRGRLDLVAEVRLPAVMMEGEECSVLGRCLCGEIASLPKPVVRGRPVEAEEALRACWREGFATAAVFPLRHNEKEVGIFNLYFLSEKHLGNSDTRLLETLGRHLAMAIENYRLICRERQYAVAEERNFMAKGLHDSIAQSLSYLYLQVQMLETALKDGKSEQVEENLASIGTGIQECYDDVRELITHFRQRVAREELPDAVRAMLARLENQAGLRTHLEFSGDGQPLAPREKLQALFILQEALSNVRKHARANQVRVHIDNREDFHLLVNDDGTGFDAASTPEGHVGLMIMKERANQIGGVVDVESSPGRGTSVHFFLPGNARSSP